MKEELNKITEKIIGAAIIVHRELGPGLLESAYEACLAYELAERKLKAQLLSYMKLSGCKIGLLVNFNVKMLKNGICRLVLDLKE